MTDPAYRCSAAARLRGDDLAGTASTVRTFLLVEHAGPWGSNAWLQARLPARLGAEVRRRAGAARVRPLLIRTGARWPSDGVTVLAAHAHPVRPWLERTRLDRVEDLLGLDLDAIGAGERPGWYPVERPVVAVCTHGKHDACCAEQGRPVAAALREAGVVESWEVSHVGGDRFAGNAVVFPHGFYYGGLDGPAGVAVAEAHARGHVLLDHLRGRSSYAMAVQYAEIALRRHLGETRVDALPLRHRHREGDVFHTEFEHESGRWRVLVRTRQGAPGRLTCQASREEPAPVREVVSLEALPG